MNLIMILCWINLVFCSMFYVVSLYLNRNSKIIANNIYERRKQVVYFLTQIILVIIIVMANFSSSSYFIIKSIAIFVYLLISFVDLFYFKPYHTHLLK